jgi:hypothetical protein
VSISTTREIPSPPGLLHVGSGVEAGGLSAGAATTVPTAAKLIKVTMTPSRILILSIWF